MMPSRRRFLASSAALAAAFSGDTFMHGLAPRHSLDPLLLLSANELSEAIHARKVSCRTVMTTYLDHIERLNPQVNAIVSLQPRGLLLDQADERDCQLAAGNSLGWMHGFPHAVKDLADTKGIRTTDGSPLRDRIPAADAPMVARLRANGAIVIGKTNVPEFALGSQTYNSIFGATGNAYDPTKTCGGSSGGAACSLALRMLPVADGTDMMGSLRNPAAFNNVFGFRPSVPKMGALSTPGPMARNIPDLANLLSVMTDPAQHEPFALDPHPAFTPAQLERDTRGIRIGWLGGLGLPFEPGILDLCEAAFPHFKSLGCKVEATTLGFPFETVWRSWVTLRHVAQAATIGPFYDDAAKRPLLKPEAIWEVEGAEALAPEQIHRATEDRAAFYAAAAKLFTRFDYLVLPSSQVFPFARTTHWPAEIAGVRMETYHQWMSVVVPASLLGAPVVDVPVGFDSAGLPMGMQIIGRPHDDLGVLQLAHAYDRRTQWPMKRLPPLLR
jgi:amidase